MSSRLQLQHYFAVPNSLVDDAIIHHLSLAEIRTLLYILRRTYGFQKTQDAISLNQFTSGVNNLDKGAGLSRKTLLLALKSLEARGLLRRSRQASPSGRCLPTVYIPTIGREQGSQLPLSPSEQGSPLPQGEGSSLPLPVRGSHYPSQNKEIQIYTKKHPPPARAGRPPQKAGTPPAITALGAARHHVGEGLCALPKGGLKVCATSCRGEAAPRPGRLTESPLQESTVPAEPTVPEFESESLKRRWEHIYSWFNQKRPLDSLTPYERRLAYRQIEELVRDPDFEPPPPGWKPPTFEEILEQMGMQNKHKGSR